MILFDRKFELKLRWTKHCVLIVINNDNTNDNPRINFSIKDTKLHVPSVTLSAKGNQKLHRPTNFYDQNVTGQ